MFNKIKERVSIEEALKFYIGQPRKNKYQCPFHTDTVPSLSIHKTRQIYKCFVCESAGDVIRFVEKLYNLSSRDACLKINNDFRLGLCNEKLSSTERYEVELANKKRLSAEAERVSKAEYKMYLVEQYIKYDKLVMQGYTNLKELSNLLYDEYLKL